MNGKRYHELITKLFAAWRKECFGDDERVTPVQDHEKCLWQPRIVSALRAAGCDLEWDFPPSSPDLNSIEGWWMRLRGKLLESEPVEFEDRPTFLKRLRRTVTALNENCQEDALKLCTNQKARARAVQRLEGTRCKW